MAEMNIIFLGGPGSGKGTQAEAVTKRFAIPQMSTGDMLRASVASKTELGLKAKAFMDKGELVPDEVVLGLVRERLKKDDAKNGFLLDGFPRNVQQAEELNKILSGMNRKIRKVIYLNVPEDLLVKRLSGRRTCKKCGEIYNIYFNKPKEEGKCTKCGGELFQRSDDNEATITNRLQVFTKQTAPLLDYYRKTGELAEIKADMAIDEIGTGIKKALES
jgi:adenylate kinase